MRAAHCDFSAMHMKSRAVLARCCTVFMRETVITLYYGTYIECKYVASASSPHLLVFSRD